MVAGFGAEAVEENVAVAQVGPEILRWQDFIAIRGIETLREVVRSEGNAVQVEPLEQVAAQCTDIGHIEHGSESDVLLDAEAEVHGELDEIGRASCRERV